MVLPPELDKSRQQPITLEQQLTEKFFELQVARQEKDIEGADTAFDEITKSIEILFRAIPEAYTALLTKRIDLDKAFEEERNLIYRQAAQAQDDIQRDYIMGNRMETAKWEYRELYEEIIIDTMQQYQLVHMARTPQVGIVPTQTSRPPEPQPIPEPMEPEPEPEPQPATQTQMQPEEPMRKMRFFSKRSNQPPTI